MKLTEKQKAAKRLKRASQQKVINRVFNLPGEEWAEIEGFMWYKVSNMGRVQCIRYETPHGYHEERILKQNKDKKGYMRVDLYSHGKKYSKRVNRLVATAFVPNPDPEHFTEVNHLSEDKTDNRAVNLKWASPKINSNWGTRNNRISNAHKGKVFSEETKDKLSAAMGKAVICDGKYYSSISRCAAFYSIPAGTLSAYVNGKTKNDRFEKLGLRFADKEERKQ